MEKGQLTSGSTCHAAGLVTQFNPSPAMMRFRRYSIELYEELGVFDAVGSLRIASSPDQLMELRRGVSRAKGIGLEVELLSPEEAVRLMPAATAESLYGAVWVPEDGFLDPHTATYALAEAARGLGVDAPHGNPGDRHRTLRRRARSRLFRPTMGASRPRLSSTPAGSGRRRLPRWSVHAFPRRRSITSTCS